MNPYELLNPQGKPCGVFCCGKCNTVLAKELADKCCVPCKCGNEPRNRFEAECFDCYKERLAARRRESLEKAEEIEWDGDFFLLSDDLPNSRDGWYPSPEEVAEEIYWRKQEDPDFEAPKFAFASTCRHSRLDLDYAIERMLEDTYDDAELKDESAVEELRKHVDAFNAINEVVYFEPDYKHKVRIPVNE